MARPPVAAKQVGGGDDLADEDDFIIDPEFHLSPNDDDDDFEDETAAVLEGEEDEFAGSEDGDGDEDRDANDDHGGASARGLKRKQHPPSSDVDEDGAAAETQKKKKKKKRPKLAYADDAAAPASFPRATPAELAGWWSASVLARETHARGLSSLELEEARLPQECWEDLATAANAAAATAKEGQAEAEIPDGSADALPEFIRTSLPKLATRVGQRPKNAGAPTCIIISAAALRATDLCRALKASGLRGEKGGEVAKLFAKHFKLQQHIDYLSKTRVSIAVATAGRLLQLLSSDALPLTALTHIILDQSHRDAKTRQLADVPEVRGEVVQLFRGVLGKKVREGKVKVVVY